MNAACNGASLHNDLEPFKESTSQANQNSIPQRNGAICAIISFCVHNLKDAVPKNVLFSRGSLYLFYLRSHTNVKFCAPLGKNQLTIYSRKVTGKLLQLLYFFSLVSSAGTISLA